VKTNELLKGLKQHRRQNRAVQNALDSIRQLKGLRGLGGAGLRCRSPSHVAPGAGGTVLINAGCSAVLLV
jgi:hypothetical protein